MERLAFITLVDNKGQDIALPAADVLTLQEHPDGCTIVLRNGLAYVTQSSVATVQAAINALWNAYITAMSPGSGYYVVAYGTGSVYSLTTTSAALDFGTTDPSVTIAEPGTYQVRGRVLLKYNGATFAANRTVTLKFRRTDNTAADLTSGSTALTTDILTASTGTWVECQMPEVIYATTNSNDAITIFGDVSTLPSAGSLDATEAHVMVHRIA